MVARALVLAAGLLCGLSAATELFAYLARLDAALGVPWWRQGWLACYAPWAIGGWAWQWGWMVPRAFTLPALAGVVVAVVMVVQTWPRVEESPAQARWAQAADLKQAECLGASGIVVGKLGRQVLRYHGKGHVLVVAATQTGKTSALVIPTLLDDPRSVIAHDPKNELWPLTSGYRSTLGRVIHLAPLDPQTDQYNPLDAVRVGTDDAFRDVEILSTYLTNPDGKASRDETTEHFQELVNQLFCGVLLYGLQSGMATTLAEVHDLLTRTAWDDLLTVLKADGHPEVQRAAEIASRPGDRERGSLQTTAARALRIFSDPRVARMTSASSFPLTALREEARPCSVYLTVPFGDQARLRPLTRLILRQLLDYCTSRLTGWRHGLLGMIDEVPSLGRLEILSDGLNFMAGFGVQLCLMTPSLEEVVDIYGVHHNLLEGCRVQAVFGLNDAAVAKKFVGRVGTVQRPVTRVTTQARGGRSITRDTKEEDLLSPTALLQLGEREVLLLAGRYKRVLAQTRYYEHPVWAARSQMPPPTPRKEEA